MSADFEQTLAHFSDIIQEKLVAALPVISENDAESRLISAMRYSGLAPGKRIRPFLVITTADLFHIPREASLQAAAAVECMHVYSLIHDDLPAMDDDDSRRGQPTCHKKFDEATATLAGDALHTLAFELLANAPQNTALELIKLLAIASGYAGMAGGQMRDLEAEKQNLDFNDIVALQQKKTGKLFEFSCEAGAILGGAPKPERQALHDYGASLGLLFQITDDLLDITGSPEKMGKAVGKDTGFGKATFVSLLGEKKARDYAEQVADHARAPLQKMDKDTTLLKQLVDYVLVRDR